MGILSDILDSDPIHSPTNIIHDPVIINRPFSHLPIHQLIDISHLLWFPNKTNWHDPDSHFTNSIHQNVPTNSWFSLTKISADTNVSVPSLIIPSSDTSVSKQQKKINKNRQKKIQKNNALSELSNKIKGHQNPEFVDSDTDDDLDDNLDNIKIDDQFNKKICTYIVPKKYDDIIYGRYCSYICTNYDHLCDKHINKKPIDFDLMAEETNLCKHIITQKSSNVDRKGMICNDFTFGSINPKYCSAHVKCHNYEDDIQNTVLQAYKIRIYPNQKQKNTLAKYFGCARVTYNTCVEDKFNDSFAIGRDKYVNYDSELITGTNLIKNVEETYIELKGGSKIEEDITVVSVTKQVSALRYNKLNVDNDFLKQCPKEIRAFAIKEYLSAKKNAEDRYKAIQKINEKITAENKNRKRQYKLIKTTKPTIKYKTKKDEQCITVNKNAVTIKNKQIIIYPQLFGSTPLKIRNKTRKKDKKLIKTLNGIINHDIKIIKTKTDKYYICITTDEEQETNEIKKQNITNDFKENKMKINKTAVSLDPGGKTFQTAYTGKEIYEIGKGVDDQLYKMYDKIELNKKKINNGFAHQDMKQVQDGQRKHRKLHEKMKNRITDMHNKAITKLLEYDTVYIPKLNTKRIVEQKDYDKKAKQVLNSLRHGAFMKKLENKALMRNKEVKKVSEYLTTKTCNVCFATNKEKVNGRIYKCENCGSETDRDMHSSELIYIKQIEDVIKISDGKTVKEILFLMK